jgi:hypothetical protein
MAKPTVKAASEPDKANREGLSVQVGQNEGGKVLRQVGAKPHPGRPSVYSEEIAEEICERLIEGESLRTICRDAHLPNRSTIARWQTDNKYFATRIAHARDIQADTLWDEAFEIADNAAGDYVEKPDGSHQVNWENVQRSKLRCDLRVRYAAKVAPKKYGEKVTQEHTGPGGGAVLLDRPKTDAEVQAEISRMLAENERELGLPAIPTMTTPERFQRVLEQQRPVTPEMYRYLNAYPGRAN